MFSVFSPDTDFKPVPACHRVLHSNGVLDFHHAAPLAEIVPQTSGLDIHRQLSKGRLVQGGVLAPFFRITRGPRTSKVVLVPAMPVSSVS